MMKFSKDASNIPRLALDDQKDLLLYAMKIYPGDYEKYCFDVTCGYFVATQKIGKPLILHKHRGSMKTNDYQNTEQGRKFLHFTQVCHKHARNST